MPDARGAFTAGIVERAQLGADIYSTEKRADGKGEYIPTAVAVDYLIRHYGFPEYEGELDADNKYSNAPDSRGVYRDTTCHLTDNVGRVLAGLVWYEMITGTPATENNYTRTTLSNEDMEKIKDAAHYACVNYMSYDPTTITSAPGDDTGDDSDDDDDDWIKEAPVSFDYAYSFALLGDTQTVNRYYPDTFANLYDWIVANADEHKIKWVFGLGDITDTSSVGEWERAQANFQKLDGVVPYSLIRGNHDGTAKLNEYFSYDAYINRTLGYWTEGTKLQNTYFTFEVGDIKYLVLCINYGADDRILSWASKIVEKYPDRNVILTTHAYLDETGKLLDKNHAYAPTVLTAAAANGNNGDGIWEKLVKKYENINFVFCGHISSDDIVVTQSVGDNGNVVTQILNDPQTFDYELEGGAGMIAMLYFSEDGKNVDVRYYSTAKDAFYKSDNQFSLEVDVVETAAQ